MDSGRIVLAQSSVTVKAVITVDNVFQLCYGPATPGPITCVGADDNFITVHNYTFTPSSNDYIYIAAWSDETLLQGFLGEFSIGSTIIRTGDPGFEVCATGQDKDTLAQAPGPTGLAHDINNCNNASGGTSGWGAPVVGQQAPWLWAGIVGFDPAAGPGAELNKFTSPFPKWIWHDAGQAAQTQVGSGNPVWYECNGSDRPFNNGCNHQEYLIFRLPVKSLIGPCIQPPAGLQEWWPLDETSGTAVNNLIPHPIPGHGPDLHNGTSNPGAIGGTGPTPIAGMVGGALQFDGVDDFVEVPDGAGTLSHGNPTSDFTIDAWIKVNPGDASGVRPIVDKRFDFPDSQNPNVHTRGYAFYLFNGQLGFQISDDTVPAPAGLNPICDAGPPFTTNCTNYVSPGPNIADGQWHHVAVTVQRTGTPEVKLYVDGTLVLTRGARTGNANSSIPLLIGSGYPIVISKPFFKGAIDEVEIFNRALDQSEIQAIFKAGPAGKCKKSVLGTAPLQCTPPQVTTVLQAGENDDFDPDPDTPAAVPATAFVAAVGIQPSQLAGFDSTSPNSHFLNSFTGLPSNIIAAQLEIRLKPFLFGGNTENDALNLWGGSTSITLLESHFLGSGNPQPGLLAQPWNTATFPNGYVFLLNLSPAVVSSMNSHNALHIQVQNDTSVDYVILRLCAKPEGTAEICVFKFEDLDGDGVRDSNEPLLPGWQFTVSPSPPAPSSVTTLPSGGICFGVSAPGTYTITEQVQSGWTPTTPPSQTVTVQPEQLVNLTFGNRKKEEAKCDLEVSKSLAHGIIPPLQPGQQVTFEIIVTNVGTGPCKPPIQVSETFSAGLTYQSGGQVMGPWICSPGPPIAGPNSVTCTNSSTLLQPGQSSNFFVTFLVTAKPEEKIKNCVVVKHPDDDNPKNNETCIEVPVVKPCDLAIKKTVTPSPVGVQVTITLTVPAGQTCAPGTVVVQDQQPPGMTFNLPGSLSVSPPTHWDCTATTSTNLSCTNTVPLTGAYTATFTFTATVQPGITIENCATATVSRQLISRSCVPVQIAPPPGRCDLQIRKTVSPNPVNSGQPVTVTLTVTNVGNGPCGPDTVVQDPPTPGLSITSPPALVSQSGGTATWSCLSLAGNVQCVTGSTLPAGYSATFTFTATPTVAPPPGGSVNIQNCATVTNPNDTNPANNQSCVTITVRGVLTPIDLTLAKLLDGVLRPEAEVTYVLRIANVGGAPTRAPIRVIDPLPPQLRFISATGAGWSCSVSGQNVICTSAGPIAPNQSSTILLRVRVAAAPGTQITNCATVETEGDANPANNRGCHTGTVQR